MAPSEKTQLSKIVQGFTAKTTFHGVRYIAEETRFLSRRITWTIVVISVIVAFSYAIVNRILHYQDYPSNIELEVGYMETVPFPVVTLCNQNPYRLTALQKYGVYDIMTNTYRAQRPQKAKQVDGSCEDTYMLNPVVCSIPAKVSYSLVFVEVTVSTCEDLCTHHAHHSCSGILYEERSKACTLTSYTGENKQWYSQQEIDDLTDTCKKSKAHFYRRVRCTDDKRIYCNFEEGGESSQGVNTESCRFQHEESLTETWIKTKGTDNTYNTDNGHFLQLFETDSRPGNTARIQSEYINTTSKCIVVFGFLGGPNKGELSIKVVSEALDTVIVRELLPKHYDDDEVDAVEETLADNEGRSIWVMLYSQLPNGIHRVIIEGTRAQKGLGGLGIDDIEIMECAEFHKDCIRSPRGVEYMGTTATSADGSPCRSWEDMYSFVFYWWWYYYIDVEESHYLPDLPIQNAENYCRNPLDISYPDGLVCLTSSFRAEPCDVPRCECAASEFRCDDGACVPWSLTCDRKPNCLDKSDETQVCSNKQTITCDFEDVYICGYIHINNKDRMVWQKEYDASVDDLAGNIHSMQLIIDYEKVLPGDTAMVITPFRSFSSDRIVTLHMKYLLNPDANGVLVWLMGSFGVSKQPVLIHGLSKEIRHSYGLPEEDLVHSIKASSAAGWVKYDLCIPGGYEVMQSLLIQAVVRTEDLFAVDSVSDSGIPCNMTQDQQETDVFAANNTGVDCTFSEDLCGYSVLSDHISMSWNLIPRAAIHDIVQFYGSVNVPATGCTNCIQYDNEDYTWVYLETTGFIQSPGYPGYQNQESSAWLIQGPENTVIVLKFIDLEIESSSSCSYDRLVIEDLNAVRNVTELCGKDIPADYYSEGNKVRLNFTSDYSLAYRGFQISYTIIDVENRSTDSVIGLKYRGDFSQYKYVSRLISPGVTFTHESCLTFTIINRSPFTVTKVSTNGANITLFEDTVVSIEDPIPVSMAITIEKSAMANLSNMLVFHGQKSSNGFVHYSIFLEDVNLHEKSCIAYSLERQQELENRDEITTGSCEFNNKSQCGYIDLSLYPIKWVRGQMRDDKGNLNTVMRYGSYSKMYKSAKGRLLSPLLNITDNSCVKIWRSTNVEETKDEKAKVKRKVHFAIESLVSNHSQSGVVTEGDIQGRDLKEETFKIPSGNYRLLFKAHPTHSGVFLYLDKVEIISDCDLYYTTGVTTMMPTHTTGKSVNDDMLTSGVHFDQTTEENESASSTPHQGLVSSTTVEDVSLEASSFHPNYHTSEPYDTMSEKYYTVSTTEEVLTNQDSYATTRLHDSMISLLWHSTSEESVATDTPDTDESTRLSTSAVWSEKDESTGVDSTSEGSVPSTATDHTESSTPRTMPTTPEPKVYIKDIYLSAMEAERMLIDDLDFEFTNFTNTVSHQKGDFLLSCMWNGLPCNDSYITETETDMGTCVSFNAESNNGEHLSSDISGQLYGLRMTLNIENYEHVEDIGTDAGIKIHFYPPSEVPIMKNMGYAVSPGYHALFSLKYTTSTFLKPKYGTCGTTELASFPDLNYTNSHCLIQCSMDGLWKTCDCHLPYMSGNQTSMCSMPDYLTCVIPGETSSSTGGRCGCPDACQQVLYDAQLSNSALSGLALHSLLSEKETQVLNGYQYALNLKHRLEKGSFLDFLTQIHDMNKEGYLLSNFLQKTSIFTVIQKGLDNIAGVVEADVDVSSVELHLSKKIYVDHLKRERVYALNQFEYVRKLVKNALYTLTWKYNPCVTWYGKVNDPFVLISKLQTLWQANRELHETLMSYTNVYKCSIYKEQCTEDLDLSKFFSLYDSGFEWAEDITFPKEAVLESRDKYYCKNFMGSTWKRFTTSLTEHIEYYALTLSNYSTTKSCKYLRPESFVSVSSVGNNYTLEEASTFYNSDNTENSNSTLDPFQFQGGTTFEETTQEPPMSTGSSIEDLLSEFIRGILGGRTAAPRPAVDQDLPEGVFDYWSAVEFLQSIESDLAEITVGVKKCFTEYGDFIESAIQWREELFLKPTQSVNTMETSVRMLEETRLWYEVLLKKYALNRLTKQELANMVTDDFEPFSLYSVMDIISASRSRFEQNVVLPMYINIDSMSRDIMHTYEQIIDDIDKFSVYMGENFNGDHLKTLLILKKPRQNLQSGLLTYLVPPDQVNGMIGTNIVRYMTNAGKQYIKNVVTKYLDDLEKKVDEYYIEYLELESNYITSIERLTETMEEFKRSTGLDQSFIRDNIMQVDVYFGELKYSKTDQKIGYTVGDFFSDLGGYLGLLLGASIVTVCEVLDLIIYNALGFYLDKKQKRAASQPNSEEEHVGNGIDMEDSSAQSKNDQWPSDNVTQRQIQIKEEM